MAKVLSATDVSGNISSTGTVSANGLNITGSSTLSGAVSTGNVTTSGDIAVTGNVLASSTLSVNRTLATVNANLHVQTTNPATVGEIVQAYSAGGQSANLTEWRNATGTPLSSVSATGVFTGNGSGLTNLAATQITGAALSVVGRSANSSGADADITAGADGNILRRSGTTLGFGTIDLTNNTTAVSGQLPATNGGMPTGAIIPYAGPAGAPAGYLLCDGSAVSRTTYANLWNLFRNGGTTSVWGNGDGSTTFNLPDLRRRVVMGSGGTAVSGPANTLASVGGSETHTLDITQIPSHTHNYVDQTFGGFGQNSAIAGQAVASNFTNTTTAAGGSGAHNNVQPSIVLYYIIKT